MADVWPRKTVGASSSNSIHLLSPVRGAHWRGRLSMPVPPRIPKSQLA